MKILQINNYHYLRGGSETIYFQTTQLLQKKGHDVIHFSTNNKENLASPTSEYFIEERDYLNQSLFNQIKSAMKFIYSKESSRKLEKLLINEKPDIAHLHIFFGQLTSSVLPVLQRYNIPTVMTVHEHKMLCPTYLMMRKNKYCDLCTTGNYYSCIKYKCNKNSRLYSILMALESYIRDVFFPYEKYINKFIYVSNYLKDKHLEYKPKLRNKSVVISNPVEKRIQNSIKGDYFLYVGRLSLEKGILTLLTAMKSFSAQKLFIVGTGEMEKELTKYIIDNNLENVTLVGYKTGKELNELYSNASFLVMPSECNETFGLTILEAYSHGKPVIAANVGAIPELFSKGESTDFLFESGNVISLIKSLALALSVNEEQYSRMSLNCIKVAYSHDMETYYEQIYMTYKEIIKESKII